MTNKAQYETAKVTFEEFVRRDGLLRGTWNYYKLTLGIGEVEHLTEEDE